MLRNRRNKQLITQAPQSAQPQAPDVKVAAPSPNSESRPPVSVSAPSAKKETAPAPTHFQELQACLNLAKQISPDLLRLVPQTIYRPNYFRELSA